MVNVVVDELRLEKHLQCHNVLALLLTCQINIAKFASSKRFSNFKITKLPPFTTTRTIRIRRYIWIVRTEMKNMKINTTNNKIWWAYISLWEALTAWVLFGCMIKSYRNHRKCVCQEKNQQSSVGQTKNCRSTVFSFSIFFQNFE